MGPVVTTDALRPGTILSGRLRVERVVGQGSMGIVLEATDLHLRHRVALKFLAPERAQSEEARKRFVREARAAVRLSSEHVTHLLDVGALADGTPFLVMEFLVGSTLEQILERDGPPPVDIAVDWVLQALDGVAEAHRQGFVHRDLKPENLFLCERPGQPPIVKVLDFGVVKDLRTEEAEGVTKLTRTGATMGSPAYMPPEQVRAEEIDQRADVWAMGVTLYELTTGRLPFGGESVPQTLAEILREEPAPLRTFRPDAPAELEALVTRALSKDPARRHASGAELLAALATVRTKIPRTSRVTKTVLLGRPWAAQRPSTSSTPIASGDPRSPRAPWQHDASAETAGMNIVPAPAPKVVPPRVVANARGHSPTSPGQPRPSLLPTIVFAFAAALVAGVLGGLLLRRHHPRTPAAAVTSPASAPSRSAAAPAPAPNSRQDK